MNKEQLATREAIETILEKIKAYGDMPELIKSSEGSKWNK